MITSIDRTQIPQPSNHISIDLGEPIIYQLDNGLTLMVVENHKLPKVSLTLMMDTPPNDPNDQSGLNALTSQLMGKGSLQVSKDDFNEEIEFLGGSISLRTQSASISSLSRYFPRILELFADAILNPNFTQEELDKEREKRLEALKSIENSTQSVCERINYALVYGIHHPYGRFETETSLKSITLDDVKNFYKENFSPTKAYMIVIGDIKAIQAQQMIENLFGSWKCKNHSYTDIYAPKNVSHTQINFIDMPHAVQSELQVFNLHDLQMTHQDYFPALIMNYILGGSFGSYINMNLREQNGFTYAAQSSISTNKWTRATFHISTKVRNEVTANAVEEILKEIKRIQTQEVTAEKLAEAKAKYLGAFILSTEKPATIAQLTLNTLTQELPKDFYKNYIKNMEAVTISDVKRVANKYIKINNLRFIIVGKKDQVIPLLQTIKFENQPIPIFYFDKYANPVESSENNFGLNTQILM